MCTTDVLPVTAHRIIETLDNKLITWLIAFNISADFGNMGDRGLLHKLCNYLFSGRVPVSIKSFLSGTSLNVIINCPSFEAHEIHSGIQQGSPKGRALIFLVNDLLNMVCITVKDITDYG